jgi:hypothetical protein
VTISQTDATSEMEIAARLLDGMESLLDRMIEQQRSKVLKLAREALPYLSAEDVLNPFDFPELKAHPTFEYEDGILAGLISAQIALRAEVRGHLAAPPPGG